jgi:hypothetical protein
MTFSSLNYWCLNLDLNSLLHQDQQEDRNLGNQYNLPGNRPDDANIPESKAQQHHWQRPGTRGMVQKPWTPKKLIF